MNEFQEIASNVFLLRGYKQIMSNMGRRSTFIAELASPGILENQSFYVLAACNYVFNVIEAQLRILVARVASSKRHWLPSITIRHYSRIFQKYKKHFSRISQLAQHYFMSAILQLLFQSLPTSNI
jgi:hypothetical protein